MLFRKRKLLPHLMQNSAGLVLGLSTTLHRHAREPVKDGRTTWTTPERIQKENSNCPAGTKGSQQQAWDKDSYKQIHRVPFNPPLYRGVKMIGKKREEGRIVKMRFHADQALKEGPGNSITLINGAPSRVTQSSGNSGQSWFLK